VLAWPLTASNRLRNNNSSSSAVCQARAQRKDGAAELEATHLPCFVAPLLEEFLFVKSSHLLRSYGLSDEPGGLLLSGEEELFPEEGELLLLGFWGELEPLLLPPGASEPPVADPGCTPKYEKTLWRQLGCVKSGQLLWLNEGAPSSFVLSPANTNDICSVLDEVAALVPYPSIPDGRINCHGTATNFSSPEVVVVVVEPVVDPGVDWEEGEELGLAPVVEDVEPLLDDPEYEITAKSIRPDAGLIMTSSTLPKSSPVEVFILEPLSLLARITCWPIRPVALQRELEPRPLALP